MADSHYKLSGNNRWQVLGLLGLRNERDRSSAISDWLVRILGPLKFNDSFLRAIEKSAIEATDGAFQYDQSKDLHILLKVSIPAGERAGGQMWGFFLIENIANQEEAEGSTDHTIEFFLYSEQSG